MPTTVTKKIGATNSPTTMDYSTIQAWEDACPANLVTADQVWDGACYDQGEFTSATQLLLVSGETTDATRYLYLRCATAAETGGQGASFKDKTAVRTTALAYNSANGVAIRCSGTYVVAVQISVANNILEGLQIQSVKGSTIGISAHANTIKSSIVYMSSTSGSGITLDSSSFQITILNCLIVGGPNGAGVLAIARNGGVGSTVIGCTVIETGAGGQPNINASKYCTHTIKDTCGFGGAQFVGSATDATGSSYNATNNATGFGSNNQTSLTAANQFVNSASDWRAVSTGSLDLNGTPDTTNIPADISGTTRHATTPTIGAWEVVASSTIIEDDYTLATLNIPTIKQYAPPGWYFDDPEEISRGSVTIQEENPPTPVRWFIPPLDPVTYDDSEYTNVRFSREDESVPTYNYAIPQYTPTPYKEEEISIVVLAKEEDYQVPQSYAPQNTYRPTPTTEEVYWLPVEEDLLAIGTFQKIERPQQVYQEESLPVGLDDESAPSFIPPPRTQSPPFPPDESEILVVLDEDNTSLYFGNYKNTPILSTIYDLNEQAQIVSDEEPLLTPPIAINRVPLLSPSEDEHITLLEEDYTLPNTQYKPVTPTQITQDQDEPFSTTFEDEYQLSIAYYNPPAYTKPVVDDDILLVVLEDEYALPINARVYQTPQANVPTFNDSDIWVSLDLIPSRFYFEYLIGGD